MKILIAHNSYQQRGGEDAVVDAEIELLRRYGNEVVAYRRHNNEIVNMPKRSVAMVAIWSQDAAKEIARFSESFQPDVIHVHNTFPLISPAILWSAGRKKIPVVQTLHNFRLVCPQAMFLRDGKICEDCLGKLPWRAVTRKCYHGSALQSAAASSMLTLHRGIGTYRNRVSAYIALNNFCREKFIAGGLPEEKIHIKPNFVEATETPRWDERGGGIFIGRLSEEKGLSVLIDAVNILSAALNQPHKFPRIRIIGGGPLEGSVREAFKHRYLGVRSTEEVRELLHASLFLLVPSICYETFGLVAVEAFSCGVPVIASRHGGLAELIKDGKTGLLFTPGDGADLAEKIAWAENNPQEMRRMGRAAYAEYLNHYTPEKNYHMLTTIYQEATPVVRGEPYAA